MADTNTGPIIIQVHWVWKVVFGAMAVMTLALIVRFCSRTDCEVMYDAHGLIPKRCEGEMMRKIGENLNRQSR